IIKGAQQRRVQQARGTILFCDEIHRFNKAQQDAFLPSVEEGLVTLIGATTENPSFALNAALLSRMRVYVLEPLAIDDITALIRRALEVVEATSYFDTPAIALLAAQADGDARRALNLVEAIVDHLRNTQAARAEPLTAERLAALLERRLPRYDRAGEEHF